MWKPQSLAVVFSVISPGQQVKVVLNRTWLNNQSTDTVRYSDAQVYISSDESEWVLLTKRSPDEAVYLDSMYEIDVVEGGTYFLKVLLPDLILSSKTTVPQTENAKIVSVGFVEGSDSINEDYSSHLLLAKFDIKPLNYCVVFGNSGYPLHYLSTFMQHNELRKRVDMHNSQSSYVISLVNMDLFLARFYAASEIAKINNFLDGDISILTGAFNGVLPAYSNIKNGIGLFGSFVVSSDSVGLK